MKIRTCKNKSIPRMTFRADTGTKISVYNAYGKSVDFKQTCGITAKEFIWEFQVWNCNVDKFLKFFNGRFKRKCYSLVSNSASSLKLEFKDGASNSYMITMEKEE